MRCKRASVDIVILVFMAVVLSSWALFTFVTNAGYVGSSIKDVRFLDNIYVREDRVEFYINSIMGSVVENIDMKGDVKLEFIKGFNAEFSKYNGNEVFSFFEFDSELANSRNVWVEDGKIFLKVKFKSSDNFGENIEVNYLGEKIFFKELVIER